MKALKFKHKRIKELKSPCYVVIPTTYTNYGVTYILHGYDKNEAKYRLIGANNPLKERYVSGDLLVVVGCDFEEI